ncbi:hypothetical protein NV379_12780 [Paenibacillus sp. N1-5-1-14]|uniref:Ger(x)C family spore germination protein n=1 Tax=Paenibacillus radicibacter TaxID=2972488 RepID=UPI002159212E|nr:hypothetical protein [Paenibacillus radicibacter]MCR8643529.1 hypothetical protein [Paenibacillus radicibacter]
MRTPSKHIYRSTLLLICMVFLMGCWDRKEINMLAIVTSAAIDKYNKDMYELSIQIYVPKSAGSSGGSEGGGGSSQLLVRSGVGHTVAEAVNNLQKSLPRSIFWGQCEVFIASKEVTSEGVRPHLDYIMREPKTRGNAYFYISQGKAKQMLELKPPLNKSTAEVLHNLAVLKVGVPLRAGAFQDMLVSDAG